MFSSLCVYLQIIANEPNVSKDGKEAAHRTVCMQGTSSR